MRTAYSWFALLLAMALSAAPLAPALAQPALAEPEAEAADGAAGGMATIAVVGLTSYDELLSDIGFIGGLAGRPQADQMIDGMIALFTQGRGLVGLDKTRPMGVVLQTDGAQFVPIACLPITDLDAVLEILVAFQIQSEEIGDGVYEIIGPDQIVYAKQVGEWVYVGQSEDALESAPADPSGVLSDLVDNYDLGARVLVQNVPPLFKQMAIGQLRAGLEAGLQQQDDESDEQFAKRSEMAQLQVQQIEDAINDLNELTLGWSVDADKETTHLDMVVTAVPGTKVAKQLEAIRDGKTRFSGFVNPDASVLARIHTTTPPEQIEEQREQIEQSIAQAKQQLMTEIDNSEELPNDAVRDALKSALGDFFEAAEATALAGVVDGVITAEISEDKLTFIGGAHMQKTDKLESALRELDAVAKEQGGADFPGIEWNAAEYGGAKFHTLTIPVPAGKPEVTQLLGNEMKIAFGIGPEVTYLAAGKDAMATLTKAIDASQAAGEVSAPPMEMILSLGDVMAFAKQVSAPDDENGAVIAMMAEMLAGSEGQDHVRFTVEPLGAGARYRFLLEKGVLKAIGAAVAAAQAAGQGF